MTGTISSFLFDMLALTIGTDGTYAYSKISGNYGNLPFEYQNEEIETFKRQYNIDPKFDPIQTMNDIEIGNDSLDNYTGSELELLNKIRQYREKALTYDPTSRYYYYKVQKVLEFARFIDNTYVSLNQIIDNQTYQYDRTFIEMNRNVQ